MSLLDNKTIYKNMLVGISITRLFMVTLSIYVWFIEESRLLKLINNYFRVNTFNTRLRKNKQYIICYIFINQIIIIQINLNKRI